MTDGPADDHRTPFLAADERTTLLAFLDYLRDAVVRKASGTPEEDARRAVVPSGTNLLGLVKHLTDVELWWFHHQFAGRDAVPFLPDGEDFAATADETAAGIIDRYRATVAGSNEIVARCADLDRPCTRNPELTLRWVLVHMVEETGRHAGHADIVRELIDGSVGR